MAELRNVVQGNVQVWASRRADKNRGVSTASSSKGVEVST
jgi:hypothetical protein